MQELKIDNTVYVELVSDKDRAAELADIERGLVDKLNDTLIQHPEAELLQRQIGGDAIELFEKFIARGAKQIKNKS